MKIDQLQHFYETAKRCHIGKAAKILRISPSAISYSIDCLERDLDVQLFEKSGKRIFLTESGKRLLEKVPDLLYSLDDIRKFVSSKEPTLSGHYSIAGTHLIVDHLISKAITDFLGGSPDVTVEVFSLRSADVISQLLSEDIDLGVCFSPQSHPTLESRILHRGELKIYVKPRHPILAEPKPLEKLTDYPAILPKAFQGIDVCENHEMFTKFQIKPNAQVAFDSYGVGSMLVKQGSGWGFFPDWLEKLPRFSLKAIDLPKGWQAPYTLNALWLKKRSLDLGIQKIVDLLC